MANLIHLCGVPRKKGFNFYLFKKESGKNIPQEWLEWLFGLCEGDGTLSVSAKGINFSIYSIHKKTLQEIQKVLGMGNIYFDEKSVKWAFRVENRFDIYLIMLILNGNLVLSHRYHNFVSVSTRFNDMLFKGKTYFKQINILLHGTLPSLSDRWFAGFSDAEGHFGLPIELKRKFISHYISITFEIGQNGENWLFIYLKDLFKGGILFTSKSKNEEHNRIIFKGSKLGSNPVTLVFDYFDAYPLYTKLDVYSEWRSIHKSLLAKEHLNKNKLPDLRLRCEKLNDKINYLNN